MQSIKIFSLLLLLTTAAFSAQALHRIVTFTQPDGTKFQGFYKGDASFHWIESNGNVVVYNPQDKYYYKARVDRTKGLVMTKEKPAPMSTLLKGISAVKTVKKTLSDQDKANLIFLHRKSKTGDYPR